MDIELYGDNLSPLSRAVELMLKVNKIAYKYIHMDIINFLGGRQIPRPYYSRKMAPKISVTFNHIGNRNTTCQLQASISRLSGKVCCITFLWSDFEKITILLPQQPNQIFQKNAYYCKNNEVGAQRKQEYHVHIFSRQFYIHLYNRYEKISLT